MIYLATWSLKQSISDLTTRSCTGTPSVALSSSHHSKFGTSQTQNARSSVSIVQMPWVVEGSSELLQQDCSNLSLHLLNCCLGPFEGIIPSDQNREGCCTTHQPHNNIVLQSFHKDGRLEGVPWMEHNVGWYSW